LEGFALGRAAMTFTIEFKERVKREDIPFIGKSALALIQRAISQRLATAPEEYGEALRYEFAGMRRLRVSNYRIIYHVDAVKRIVTIAAIGHRSTIYDQ
jgi:mRNA interferase RelE/StbE